MFGMKYCIALSNFRVGTYCVVQLIQIYCTFLQILSIYIHVHRTFVVLSNSLSPHINYIIHAIHVRR